MVIIKNLKNNKMEIQDYIENLVRQQRDKSFANSPQFSLGEFMNEIENCGTTKDNGEEKDVCFDFGSAVPTSLDSWRGSYNELALGYKLSGYDNNAEHFSTITAKGLLAELKSAIGKTYTGWKGGEFTMNERTPVWVSHPGNASNTAIVGVLNEGWRLVILTAYCEF
jgi:hypothetical protein